MDEDETPRSIDAVLAASEVGEGSGGTAGESSGTTDDPVAAIEATAPDDRKAVLRSLREHAEEHPSAFASVLQDLTGFLTDEERAVRLTTAKLFVAVAEGAPESVEPVLPALAERLADDEEFYFVRARAAEALGYAALACPEAVGNPETIADMTIGLAFDEPEVKTKLAKALEHVAFGDPTRLEFHVETLAEHVADDGDLVRYHCATALATIACERPDAVAEIEVELVDRCAEEDREDGGAFVLGRAAEALGILARTETTDVAVPAGSLPDAEAVGESFATDRIAFARAADASGAAEICANENDSAESARAIGTIEGIRATTAAAVEEMTAPEDVCPNCGVARPPQGPPICPGCGAPF